MAAVSYDTAVERFSRHHDISAESCGIGTLYSDILPLEAPKAGEQYSFEVDLDACTGCKACVAACHSLNGLDPDESWRSVGLLLGTTGAPYQQVVTTACHHCVDPGCMKGCPVDAYEKDPVTGIVKHLDDQCIGCRYCTLTCPYEVPRFNERRGIVRKCDMCSDRLAVGEAPACAQACPNGAIKIRVIDQATARARADLGRFLPAAPDPRITIPTTAYISNRSLLQDSLPADHDSIKPSHGHPPLAVMLVLTQVAVGAGTLLALGRLLKGNTAALFQHSAPALATVVLALTLVGIASSISHLGRPRFAFRAALGFMHSWLSREIVAFGAFAALAALVALQEWGLGASKLFQLLGIGALGRSIEAVAPAFVAVSGLAAVYCSIMIYVATGKRWWRARTTGYKFALTCAVGGGSLFLAVFTLTIESESPMLGSNSATLVRTLSVLVVACSVMKLALEGSLFRRAVRSRIDDLSRTSRLLRGPLSTMTRWRFTLGGLGGVLCPLSILALSAMHPFPLVAASVFSLLGVTAVVSGELIERLSFFLAVSSPRMPGGIQ